MSLNVGDAVLTFLGDTTQLDQAFARIPGQAEASMAAATGSVSQLGTAFQGINFELDATASNVPFAGEQIANAMEKSRSSTYEARGELGLLGELFGIHLPRHVRSFVADLPGVGEALSGAFAATAVIFLVEALVKGIEKIQAWREEAHKNALAWDEFNAAILNSFNGLDDKLLSAGIKIDELNQDHVGALKKELERIDHQSLQELVHEFDILGKAADAVFAHLKASWYEFGGGSTDAKNALDDFMAQYRLLLAESEAGVPGKDEEASKLLHGALKSAQATLATLQKAKQTAAETSALAEDTGRGAPTVGGVPTEKEIKSVEALVTALNAQVEAEKKINELKQKQKEIKEQEAALAAEKEGDRRFKTQAQEDKRQADEQEILWKEHYTEALADLVQNEKEKIAATKAGSQARLAAIDAAIKDEEAHGLQETPFYRSLQEQRVKFVTDAIAAQQKAENQATAASLKTAETEAKVETATVLEKYSEQEKAVTELGSFKLLTASQTSARLQSLYTQENTKLLAILNDLLKKEQDAIKAAQSKLSAAESNPFITPQQIDELKKLLEQAEQAEAATQIKIAATTKTFHDKQLTLDKGAYGQALALAIASGNQQLALDLKQHHAAELAIQDQIALTKARGGDVTALQAQAKEIANTTNALIKEATQMGKLRQAWDIFSADFAKKAKADETTAQQMAQSFDTAVQGLESGIQSAFAAMVDGTESAGKAMEKAVFKTIASIAEQWGAYYLARAIADTFDDPAAAAGEYAAGAALEALGGVLSGLSSLGGSRGSSGSPGSGPISTTGGSSAVAGAGGPQVVNVPRLSGGGLITHQTLAIVGDSPSGGSQREAVIPLNDPAAMREIMAAFGASGGGAPTIYVNVKGSIDHGTIAGLVQKINRKVRQNTVHLKTSDSLRITRRSQ